MAKKIDLDFKLLGIQKLEKRFKKLTRGDQGKVVRPALRDSAKRAKGRVLANLSGLKVNVDTGVTLKAFTAAPVRSAKRSSGEIRIGQLLPSREDLGIPDDAKHYYPMAIEYGHKGARARPFMRPAIDEHRASELQKIGADIGQRITKQIKVR